MRRFIVVAVLGLLTVLLGAGPASAHAALVGTDPEQDARLQTMPSNVTFTFNENVGNAFIAVTAPDGTPVETAKVRAVDNEVSTTLTDPDQRGVYSASYRVVSADGHPVSGTVTFTVLTGQAVAQVAPRPAQESFFDRHLGHVIWGALAGLAAIALIVVPMRRRDDAHHA